MANKHEVGTNVIDKRGLSVTVRGNDLESALRLLRKRCNQEGMPRDMRKIEYYEKPKWARKRKKAEAKKRWRRKQQEMNSQGF